MRTLTDSEKRTIRYATIGIAVYLVLFGGFQAWKFFEKRRADYQQVVEEAQDLKAEVRRDDAADRDAGGYAGAGATGEMSLLGNIEQICHTV